MGWSYMDKTRCDWIPKSKCIEKLNNIEIIKRKMGISEVWYKAVKYFIFLLIKYFIYFDMSIIVRAYEILIFIYNY